MAKDARAFSRDGNRGGLSMFNLVQVRQLRRCLAICFVTAVCSFAQHDPGVRGGPAGAGGPIAGLTAGETDMFSLVATPAFAEVDAVKNGLGPRFNLDSCGGCHAHPAMGGSSPANNPQFTQAVMMAPGNTIPSFIAQNGPVREARFIKNPDGSPDGGVHDVFTITGRTDNPAGCSILQPNFAQQQANNNVIFRIPTPTFGDGLIEEITDTTIKNNLASNPLAKALLGIKGHVNTNGNDGTVTRFGWKAQNKSL
jgi:mono/diheme cytochrome c family protein